LTVDCVIVEPAVWK